MAVPDRDDFTLQNVVTEVNPTTNDLVDCFADADSAKFDSSYSGTKNQLLNFRNYGATGFAGYEFSGYSELVIGVNLWVSNRAQAIIDYGQINTWCTQNVITMLELFDGKTTFNDDISNWDVSNVTASAVNNGLFGMFWNASSFNQNIGAWDVSKVVTFRSMFIDASAFNNNGSNSIGNWDVSSVGFPNRMDFMFDQTNFNQDISAWCVENIPSTPAAFSRGAPLTAANTPNWGVTCP